MDKTTLKSFSNKKAAKWITILILLFLLVKAVRGCVGCFYSIANTDAPAPTSTEMLNKVPLLPYKVEVGQAVFLRLTTRWSRWIDASEPAGTYWKVISSRGHWIQFPDGTLLRVEAGEEGAQAIPPLKKRGMFRLKSLDNEPDTALIRLSWSENFPRYIFKSR